jgi:hypothetical protein
MCSSDERAAKAPKVVRVVSYNIKPGKEAELRAKVDAITSDKNFQPTPALTLIAVAETGAHQNVFVGVLVFNTEAALNSYVSKELPAMLTQIKEFVDPKATISEYGPQFHQAFKPVRKGENLRIVVFPGNDLAQVRATAKKYRQSLPNGKIPGYQGGAYAETKAGALFGYQAFDTAANCKAYNDGAIKSFKEAGLTGENYQHAEGEVIYASAKSSLFDEFPLGGDVRNATGTVFDHTESIFQNVPLGNYVIDGVTYSVEQTQAGVDQVVSISDQGVKTTYQITTDGVKIVPGGEHVVNAGEQGYAMGSDGVKQGMNATNQVTDQVTGQVKGVGTQAYDGAKGAATAVPGVNEATNATMQGVDAAKGVSNQASGYVNQGVDAGKGAVTSVPGVNEAVSAGEAGMKAGTDGLNQVQTAADGGLQAAGSAAAQGKEASASATRSCF